MAPWKGDRHDRRIYLVVVIVMFGLCTLFARVLERM